MLKLCHPLRWFVPLLLGVFLCQLSNAQQQIPNPFELAPDTPLGSDQNQPASPAPPPAGEQSRSESDESPSTNAVESAAARPPGPLKANGAADAAVESGNRPTEAFQAEAAASSTATVASSDAVELNDNRAEEESADPEEDPQPLPQQPALKPDDQVRAERFDHAMIIDLRGAIFGRFQWYFNNRLDLAREQGVDLIILRLTTPGGDAEASLQMARRLRDLDWATSIIFVPQEAISGGAILSFGADRIYMQEGALIGDAGPIRLGMQGFEHAEEKVVSYLAEAVGELAAAKGRPRAIAEAMVDRKLVVLQATLLATGERVFVTQEQVDASPGDYQVIGPVPETQQDRFLTVAANRAEQLLLCEGVFASEEEMLASLTIEKLTQTELNWVDSTVYWLNRPWLTALLLIAGLIGLYFELAAPGISVAGLTSVFCFTVFFWSHVLGGTAGWLEVLLFLVGVTCMICELFLVPGFGVFGISGIAMLILSLVMASQDFVVPESPQQWSQLRSNLLIVVGSVLGVMVLFIAQVLLLDTIPGLNRFRLAAPEGEPVASVDTVDINRLVHDGETAITPNQIGDHGVAESDLRPSGKVLIDNRLVDVVTEGDYVSAGTPIEIIKIEGNRVIVRRR